MDTSTNSEKSHDKSLIISARLHKQIKMKAVEQDRPIREVVEAMLTAGLQNKTAA